MTDSEIAEIRRTKTELDARARLLNGEQIRLRTEFDIALISGLRDPQTGALLYPRVTLEEVRVTLKAALRG